MRKIWVVAKNTYISHVKSWAFLIVLLLPIILAYYDLGSSTSSNDADNYSNSAIGIVTKNETAKDLFESSNSFYVYKTVASAKKDMNNFITGYAVLKIKDNRAIVHYYGEEKLSKSARELFNDKLSMLESKLTLKREHQELSQPVVKQQINQKRTSIIGNKLDSTTYILMSFLLLMIVVIYNIEIAQDIAAEKGSKMLQVVFSSMPGGNYLLGKILGVIGELTTHLACYFLIAEIYLAKNPNKFAQAVIGKIWSPQLLFVILGALLGIIVSAYVGAFVQEVHNASRAVLPVTAIYIVAFIIVVTTSYFSESTFTRALSYVPIFSSFLMPERIIIKTAGFGQVTLSLLITLGVTGYVLWIMWKTYPSLVLQTDDNHWFRRLKRILLQKKDNLA